MRVYCVFKPDHIINMYDVIYDLHEIYLNKEDAESEIVKLNNIEKNKSYSEYADSPAYLEEKNIK